MLSLPALRPLRLARDAGIRRKASGRSSACSSAAASPVSCESPPPARLLAVLEDLDALLPPASCEVGRSHIQTHTCRQPTYYASRSEAPLPQPQGTHSMYWHFS